MSSIKVRNGMDLKEAEDIKKRWQEYTELYKKELHDPDNHDGVIIEKFENADKQTKMLYTKWQALLNFDL